MNQTQNEQVSKATNNHVPVKINLIEYYKISIPWFKSLIWPSLILILVLVLKYPIYDILDILPDLINRTKTLESNSMSLEFDEEIIERADEDISEALIGLSDKAFSTIIRAGETPDSKYADVSHVAHGVTNCSLSKEELLEYHSGYLELKQKGLITIDQIEYLDCGIDVFWKWTNLGLRSYETFMDILLSVISKELQ